jgi:hypothetical protein
MRCRAKVLTEDEGRRVAVNDCTAAGTVEAHGLTGKTQSADHHPIEAARERALNLAPSLTLRLSPRRQTEVATHLYLHLHLHPLARPGWNHKGLTTGNPAVETWPFEAIWRFGPYVPNQTRVREPMARKPCRECRA